MKIGLVLPAPPAYSETFFTSKIKHLRASGFEVLIFADTFKPSNDPNVFYGINLLKSRWLNTLSLILPIFKLFKSPKRSLKLFQLNKADGFSHTENLKSLIISSHIINHDLDWLHFGFATTAIARENLAKVIGAKMAVSLRGYGITVYPLKHPGCYNLLWKRIDKLHYLSNGLLEMAVQHGFNTNTFHEKITPAIDFKAIQKHAVKSNDIPRITTIARLHWIKGLEYTLEALALVNKMGFRFNYHIIGEGEDLERLIFAAYQLGIKDLVSFRGKIAHENIFKELSETDFYIQYSIEEGFGNSVIEAQAAGAFCIVSDAVGLKENILDGITGFVINKRNPKFLAEAITKALELSDSERNNFTQRAFEYSKATYNIEDQTRKFLAFYQ